MRRTEHPCPGCGTTGYWGKKGEICSDCKYTLQIGTETLKARERRNTDKKTAYLIPWVHYALPHIQHGSGYQLPRYDKEKDATDKFEVAYYALLQYLGEPLGKANVTKGEVLPPFSCGERCDATTAMVFPVELAKLLSSLYTLTREIAAVAYKEGKHKGQNLLYNIASGEMTIADLNRQNIVAGKEDEEDEDE